MDDLHDAEVRIGQWVKRIKETAAGKREADASLDSESLARAADFEKLYTAMRWADEMPAPKKPKGRGRRVDPKSREQFAKWVRQHYEWGSKQRLAQLHDAAIFVNGVDGTRPTSEWAVRPLWTLRDQGYGDHIPQVWAAACKLAGGLAPTRTETARAVREFLEAHRAPARNVAADDRTAAEIRAARRKKLIAEFDAILAEENRVAKDALNEMIRHFNEHQQELKAS